MAEPIEADVSKAVARDRAHLAGWRSTTAGEVDYQETVERVRALSGDHTAHQIPRAPPPMTIPENRS